MAAVSVPKRGRKEKPNVRAHLTVEFEKVRGVLKMRIAVESGGHRLRVLQTESTSLSTETQSPDAIFD